MTDKRDVLSSGERLAVLLIRCACNPQRRDGKQVSIPINLLIAVTDQLFALSGSHRGRPPKESTSLAQLLARNWSKRKAARAVSSLTGEPIENLRRRLRPKKPSKPKRKAGT